MSGHEFNYFQFNLQLKRGKKSRKRHNNHNTYSVRGYSYHFGSEVRIKYTGDQHKITISWVNLGPQVLSLSRVVSCNGEIFLSRYLNIDFITTSSNNPHFCCTYVQNAAYRSRNKQRAHGSFIIYKILFEI